MAKRLGILFVVLWALVAFGLYRAFHETDPVKNWTRQAIGTWELINGENRGLIRLYPNGTLHFRFNHVEVDGPIEAEGTWQIEHATEEVAVLSLSQTSGLENWIEQISASHRDVEIDDIRARFNKFLFYLETDAHGTPKPVMLGNASSGVVWTAVRDADWQETTAWDQVLVGHWYLWFPERLDSQFDPREIERQAAADQIGWTSEVRADGTWNWRMDSDIGTWRVIHDWGDHAVVEFVETGDTERRILTYQALMADGSIKTLMFTDFSPSDSLSDKLQVKPSD